MNQDVLLKAFDFASTTTQLLITLATGTLALSITFAKEIAPETSRRHSRRYLMIAWLFYILSIPFGILTMMALTGQLTSDTPSIVARTVTIPGMLQVICFILALIFTMVYGVKALFRSNKSPNQS
jgi:hypothetical protein